MITLRPSNERGHFDFGWLDTRHSFAFGQYQDPAHLSFHALRVLNEDVVQPGQGFGTHGHRDMEILTWVLEGALAHRDSTGNEGVLRPGDAQRMSAGSGIRHSEYNASASERVHFLQIWLFPEREGLTPGYEQRAFPEEGRRNRWALLASPDGAEGSLAWRTDARLHVADLEAGRQVALDLAPGRAAWVQVARGRVEVNGVGLGAGDGAALEGESSVRIHAATGAEVLLFDLA
ncbi:pirin family protein [Mesoterricola sediminis]|uniref:Quercetin 2,3-dioxygenase n=1 Tax=Mesoterricola sediminis TaxID=2927980 RepID=A0AA48GU00_9BACT|nr:pirin family protein [Mesoterricola sediminis]BDU76169.1 quercetin 2,3-dioxygenase [Mesoterricola sediminis]